MRRIVTAALATVSSLVLLFAYPTSHDEALTGTGSASGGDAASAATPSSDDDSQLSDPSSASSGNEDGTDDGDDDADDGAGSPASSTSAAASSKGGSATAGSSKSGSSKTSSSSSKTYKGDEVQTQWGVVQVQITVKNGRITAAEALKYPDSNHHDQQINAYALPILNAAAVKAQSASIDSVSGATVTSRGYVQSLQSALDAARL